MLKERSLIFAPMEGITDAYYRKIAMEQFPGWDYFFTPFFRIQTVGKTKPNQIIDHIGKEIYKNNLLMKKTIFQLIATKKSQTEYCVSMINDLNIENIDLNIGCPSKQVNSHGGGAILIDDLQALCEILRIIRKNYKGIFSVKTRIGYRNNDNFNNLLNIISNEGVDFVTIHGRVAKQMFSGNADWSFVKQASDLLKIPVVGNGDVETINDIDDKFQAHNCHSIMIGRGALKRPWLADTYKSENKNFNENVMIVNFLFSLVEILNRGDMEDAHILQRCKAISYYLFDHDQIFKKNILRSMTIKEFFSKIDICFEV